MVANATDFLATFFADANVIACPGDFSARRAVENRNGMLPAGNEVPRRYNRSHTQVEVLEELRRSALESCTILEVNC